MNRRFISYAVTFLLSGNILAQGPLGHDADGITGEKAQRTSSSSGHRSPNIEGSPVDSRVGLYDLDRLQPILLVLRDSVDLQAGNTTMVGTEVSHLTSAFWHYAWTPNTPPPLAANTSFWLQSVVSEVEFGPHFPALWIKRTDTGQVFKLQLPYDYKSVSDLKKIFVVSSTRDQR